VRGEPRETRPPAVRGRSTAWRTRCSAQVLELAARRVGDVRADARSCTDILLAISRLLLVLVAMSALFVCAPAGAATRCLGAASRDPAKPCVNAKLKRSVTPSPRDAPIIPGTACTKLAAEDLVVPCAFGAAAASARGTLALIGDSHAAHWRPTVTRLAQRIGWRGVTMTLNSCGLTTVPRALPEPEASNCARWKTEIVDWLGRHPEITTLFISQRVLAAADFGPGGLPPFSTQVTGMVDFWDALPASLKHVIVIRDNPRARASTLPCVSAAIRRKWVPAAHCGLARSSALRPDPAEAAVAALGDPRFTLVDLSPHFCDARQCFPVVGGVLVYRDDNHLTTLFAETLAPYLQRALPSLH
jgi:hypothetical protein